MVGGGAELRDGDALRRSNGAAGRPRDRGGRTRPKAQEDGAEDRHGAHKLGSLRGKTAESAVSRGESRIKAALSLLFLKRGAIPDCAFYNALLLDVPSDHF
jgi:hypothetical protein